MTATVAALLIAAVAVIQVVGALIARRRAERRQRRLGELIRLLHDLETVVVREDSTSVPNVAQAKAIYDATFEDVFRKAYHILRNLEAAEDVAVGAFLDYFMSDRWWPDEDPDLNRVRARLDTLTRNHVFHWMREHRMPDSNLPELDEIKSSVLDRVTGQLEAIER